MGAKQEAGTRKADEKKDKTVLVVKLEKFDTAAKIKLIKEVRVFTILGHSEAKMLAYCGREGEEERLRSWSRKESNFKTKNIEVKQETIPLFLCILILYFYSEC